MRIARPDDSDAIVDIHVQARRSYYAGHVLEELLSEWEDGVRRGGYRELISRPDRTWLTAERDGEVVGFALLGPSKEPGTGELLRIHVDPSRWRAGAGRALHDACVSTGELVVFERNDRARAFYDKLGWEEVEDLSVGDPPHVRLRLALPTAA